MNVSKHSFHIISLIIFGVIDKDLSCKAMRKLAAAYPCGKCMHQDPFYNSLVVDIYYPLFCLIFLCLFCLFCLSLFYHLFVTVVSSYSFCLLFLCFELLFYVFIDTMQSCICGVM